MNEEELAKALDIKNRIPTELMKHIRFLSKWDEPPNFRLYPKKQRIDYMSQIDHRLVEQGPTTNNFWIWFGAYHKETGIAWYDSKYVQRQLYDIFRGPVGTRRLTNHFSKSPSDVNPWKCEHGMPGYLNHINLRKDEGDDYYNEIQKFLKTGRGLADDKVAKCVAEIEENGFVEMGFDLPTIRQFMLDYGHPPPIIEEALRRLGVTDTYIDKPKTEETTHEHKPETGT